MNVYVFWLLDFGVTIAGMQHTIISYLFLCET